MSNTNDTDLDNELHAMFYRATLEWRNQGRSEEQIHGVNNFNTGVGVRLRKELAALVARREAQSRIEGMKQAKSRVLRRTEIPADAKNPTRDAVVILGEQIADIIQGDIDALTTEATQDGKGDIV